MPRGNANYGETTEVMFPVRRVIGIGVALIAAVFAAAAVVRPEGITLLHIGVALVVVVIGLAPGIAQMVTKPSRIARFPLMALTGAFYAAFFGAPVMVIGVLRSDDREGYRFLSNASVEQLDLWILVLITAGLSLLLVTWLTVRHLLDPLLPRYRIVVQGDLAARILAWALLLIAIAYPAFPVLSTLPSVGQIAFPAGVAGFAILMLASYRGGLGVWERRAFLWIALPVWLVELILHGSVTPVLLIAVLWIAMYWRRNGSLPWKVIAVFLVSAILVYASLGIYRDLIWTTSAGHTTAGRAAAMVESVARLPTDADNIKHGAQRLVRRISMVLPLAFVVENTPDPVPHWNGETFRPALTNWIPRFLWSDKPQERFGNAFAKRYGLIGEGDGDMSVNMPWITELFANFGTAGVIVGMALIGAFLGLLDVIFNRPHASDLDYTVGATILLPLWFQESNFSLMTGSIIPLAVFFWIYFSIGSRVLQGLLVRVKRTNDA